MDDRIIVDIMNYSFFTSKRVYRKLPDNTYIESVSGGGDMEDVEGS